MLNTPLILLSMNGFGLSIDLSTCVSAAKLKTTEGLCLFNILRNITLLNLTEIVVVYKQLY